MAEIDRAAALASIQNAPYAAALGLKIESAKNGAAVARMPFDVRLLNDGGPGAPVHGGAIASLADFAACAAIWSLKQTTRSATISITINYEGFAIKSDLIARATVRRPGKRVASIAVEIRDHSDALVADALVTYKIA
ncbi:MAG TPA: PaaI family thioesterase [Candidatus Binataceae bacterium]